MSKENENQVKGEPIQEGDQEMEILADDSITPHDKAMAASAGVQQPPAPVTGPASALMEEQRDEFGRKTSFIGQMGQKLLNAFISQHKESWESLQAAEREKKECAGKFKFYTKTLAELKTQADHTRAVIENYKGVDLAETFFQGMFKIGYRFEQFFTPPYLTGILASFFFQLYGDAVLKKIEDEIGAMAAEFSKFKQSKRTVLKELKLI